jgi:hypothetical protein
MKGGKIVVLTLLPLIIGGAAIGADILFQEEFASLERWKEVFFPKIPAHTRYTLTNDGGQACLRMESHASASILAYREPFNPYAYPRVKWRWKVENILPQADLKTKSGDDAPIRVYVAFAYDPRRASILERAQYNAVKFLYGEYPPHSSLNYVWASQASAADIITSAYTERSKMILLEKGEKNVGKWVEEEVNIIADYRRTFGEDPPAKATIGIMNDSDNTGGSAVSYVTSLMVFR